jgi:hypothetical protein
MKERLLESLAILLAGLFSAERPKQRLGDAGPPARRVSRGASSDAESYDDPSAAQSGEVDRASGPRGAQRVEH